MPSSSTTSNKENHDDQKSSNNFGADKMFEYLHKTSKTWCARKVRKMQSEIRTLHQQVKSQVTWAGTEVIIKK
ncbi:unnamed protein product, partial [Iphiclides podalirius]